MSTASTLRSDVARRERTVRDLGEAMALSLHEERREELRKLEPLRALAELEAMGLSRSIAVSTWYWLRPQT